MFLNADNVEQKHFVKLHVISFVAKYKFMT